jgi:WD40 repeat protein
MFGAVKNNWLKGEFQDIPLEPPHDRGVFCADIQGDQVVTGSADHGLRVYNLSNGKYRRELFTKRCGHKEWVTTCAFLPDGRILSGGMDSQLCLWKKNSVVCDHIGAHDASISKVQVDEHCIALSSSYDCFINVWDMNTIDTVQQLYGPHKKAVLDFDWRNSLVVSGDKNGVVAFWDLNTGRHVAKMQAHGKGIGCCKLYSDNVDQHLIITTGLKDGIVNVFDMRTNRPVYTERLHSGAVNKAVVDMSGNSKYLTYSILTGVSHRLLRRQNMHHSGPNSWV